MIVLVMRPHARSSPLRVIGEFESRKAAYAWLEEHPGAWRGGFGKAEAHQVLPPAKYE